MKDKDSFKNDLKNEDSPKIKDFLKIQKTSQAEQGHTRVPSSPRSNWTQSIQQSSNLLDLFYTKIIRSKKSSFQNLSLPKKN